ncbi:NAD(P)/FAD-dependent oxidoreductase [Roseibium sp. SCP14]|uniref:NAD(P)/FAD-dependent oxidoreductase n=1 Tax=Roseibium sp. SCP14 TaxID=3141375 RepID=UPI003336981B
MYDHLTKTRKASISKTARNDNSCGWIETLPARTDFPQLQQVKKADWVVVGGGFSGLAAARRLAELYPETSIALIDAQRVGECSAGRNSGFVVDTSPGRVGDDEAMKSKALANYLINKAGLDYLRETVRRHVIECDWDDNGKFHCAAEPRHAKDLNNFEKVLQELGVPYEWMKGGQLEQRLGIPYYHTGLWTKQAALVQPAALARGLLQTLPENVSIYENTRVRQIDYGQPVHLLTEHGTLTATNVVVATNGLLGEFGLFKGRLMHLTLTASLTRPLTTDERATIGDPAPWGILSAHRMGATIRYTNDHRIMMRNTAEFWPKLAMNEADLAKRRARHMQAIRTRWPMLPDLGIEHTWSGVVAVSRNFSSVFAQPLPNVLAVGGFNAGGIARGTGLAKLLIDQYAGVPSAALSEAQKLAPPSVLPPRPLLDIGAGLNIARMGLGRGKE